MINVGHEIRTPLSSVLAAAEMLADENSKEDLELIKDLIRSSGYELLTTVEKILEFSQSKEGKLEFKTAPFQLRDIAKKVRTEFVHKGIKLGIGLEAKEVEPNLPDSVIGDEERVIQVLNMLLENAAKFSVAAPVAVLALTEVERTDDYTIIQFSLSDNGIGISQKDIGTIFDFFHQADSSPTRKIEGVGIGLSICKQIVEIMGGKIWIESTLGQGTTVYFTVSFGLRKLDDCR